MTALADLSALPPVTTQRGGDPRLLWAEMRHLIEHAIANDPRTLQAEIGPSEIGTDCMRCLGMKLAGIPEERDAAWLPTVGKAVHTWLEEVFTTANAGLPEARWLVETRVHVGDIDGRPITGCCDLYDRVTATASDYKVQGVTQQRRLKANGPSATYRRQLHLYARGLIARGLPVDTVQLVSLPRNEQSLLSTVVWHEPYQESIALEALAKADALAKAIRLAGPEAVIPSLPAEPGCYSCPRFRNLDGTRWQDPSRTPRDDLTGLVAPTTPATPVAGTTTAA